MKWITDRIRIVVIGFDRVFPPDFVAMKKKRNRFLIFQSVHAIASILRLHRDRTTQQQTEKKEKEFHRLLLTGRRSQLKTGVRPEDNFLSSIHSSHVKF